MPDIIHSEAGGKPGGCVQNLQTCKKIWTVESILAFLPTARLTNEMTSPNGVKAEVYLLRKKVGKSLIC